MRKWVLWGIGLIGVAGLVAGGLWLRRQSPAASVPEVLRTDQVVRGNLEISVSASGNIAVSKRTDVATTISGNVDRVLVAPNDRVVAGQTLATLDTADLQRAVSQAELGVEQAKLALATEQEPPAAEDVRLAELALTTTGQALEVAEIGRETARVDADAMIVQAQRQREQAFIRFRDANDGKEKERSETALQEAEAEERIARMNAELTLKQAESQWQVAYSGYLQAKSNLDSLADEADPDAIQQRQLQVQQAQLRLEQAQRNLRQTAVTAPYDGIVAAVLLEEGAMQRGGETAFTIVDDTEFTIDVTIDEIDIAQVAPGQPAEVSLDAFPGSSVMSVVESIAPSSTNLGGLVTYRVRLRIEDRGGIRIMDGMTASARIRTNTVDDVLLVPSWAARFDQDTSTTYCLRMADGVPQRTDVVLGRSNESYSEVISGLAEGDTVALVAEARSLFEGRPQGGPPGFDQ